MHTDSRPPSAVADAAEGTVFCLPASKCHGTACGKVRRSHETKWRPRTELQRSVEAFNCSRRSLRNCTTWVGLASRTMSIKDREQHEATTLYFFIASSRLVLGDPMLKTGAARRAVRPSPANRHLAQSFFRPFVGLACYRTGSGWYLSLANAGKATADRSAKRVRSFRRRNDRQKERRLMISWRSRTSRLKTCEIFQPGSIGDTKTSNQTTVSLAANPHHVSLCACCLFDETASFD